MLDDLVVLVTLFVEKQNEYSLKTKYFAHIK